MAQGEAFSIFLSFFTGASIVLYWGLTFTGVTPIEELVPGYRSWAWSFVPADGWIALCAFATGALLLREDGRAVPLGLLTAGSLIFLALSSTAYSFVSGVLSKFTAFEIAIKMSMRLYFFVAGGLFIYLFWTRAAVGCGK